MSGRDVHPDDMKWLKYISERDADLLLSGRCPEGSPESEDVARFVSGLDAAVSGRADAGVEATHLAAMMEAAREVAEGAPALGRPAASAAPAGPVDRLRAALAPRGVRIALVAAGIGLALGGTAYAGILPGPFQRAVAGVARAVGISLPAPAVTPAPDAPRPVGATVKIAPPSETTPVAPGAGTRSRAAAPATPAPQSGNHDGSQVTPPSGSGPDAGGPDGSDEAQPPAPPVTDEPAPND